MRIKRFYNTSYREKKLVKKVLMTSIVVTVLSVFAGVAFGNVRTWIPDGDPYAPVYVRFVWNEQVAAAIFYRSPDCVPDDFNLGDFWHIPTDYAGGAYACELTVQGFEIFEEEPPDLLDPDTWVGFPDTGGPAPPIKVNLHEDEAVPVWFVSAEEFHAATADGVLTMPELESLSSLLIGTASFYHETLHPEYGHDNPMMNIVAQGTFEEGPHESFRLQALWVDQAAMNGGVIHIIFE